MPSDLIKELKKLQRKLENAREVKFYKRDLPAKKGCYLIREKGTIAYVGETANLKARMRDLGITYNHSLRRHIGFKITGKKVGQSTKYSKAQEEKIDDYFSKCITIAYIPVEFGRKELEEHMVKEHRATLYNKKQRR